MEIIGLVDSGTLPLRVQLSRLAGLRGQKRPYFSTSLRSSPVITPDPTVTIRLSLSTSKVLFILSRDKAIPLKMGIAPTLKPVSPPRGLRGFSSQQIFLQIHLLLLQSANFTSQEREKPQRRFLGYFLILELLLPNQYFPPEQRTYPSKGQFHQHTFVNTRWLVSILMGLACKFRGY